MQNYHEPPWHMYTVGNTSAGSTTLADARKTNMRPPLRNLSELNPMGEQS